MSEREPHRVFIAWDHSYRQGLRDLLRRVEKSPGADGAADCCVKTLGLDDSAAGAVWDDVVRQRIEWCDRMVAYVDNPNANVCFEVGYALGSGKDVRLVRHAQSAPRWMTNEPPFVEELAFQASTPKSLRACCSRDGAGKRVFDEAASAKSNQQGGETLILCPRNDGGETTREFLERDWKLPSGWRLFAAEGRGFNQLSEALASATRVVWIVLPYPEGSDHRDGQENAAAAAVAGFALARGLDLSVCISAEYGAGEEQRVFADVGRRSRLWSGEDELGQLLDEIARESRAEDSSTDDVLARYFNHLERWNSELIPFFSRFEAKTLGDVYVERIIEEVRPEAGAEAEAPRGLVDAEPLDDAEALRAFAAAHDSGHFRHHRRWGLRALIEDPTARGEDGLPRWAILGKPGSGKSTLCRRLCATLAAERGAVVPVLLSLAHWAREVADPFELIERDLGAKGVGLADRLREIASNCQVAPAEPAGEETTRASVGSEGQSTDASDTPSSSRTGPPRVWLLLDGLDEVREEDLRSLRARLDQFLRDHPGCPVVLTSRDAGYRDLGLPFERLRLIDLGRAEAQKLLARWIPEHASAVWTKIEAEPNLRKLAGTPLLLTLIAKLALERKGEARALPVRKLDLYKEAIDLLLKRGVESEPKSVQSPRAAVHLLPDLSRRLQLDGAGTWKEDEILDHLLECCQSEPYLRRLKPWWKSPEAFLEDIRRASGILAPQKGPTQPWEFLHRSLKEYLAARGFVEGDASELIAKLEAIATDIEQKEDDDKRTRARDEFAQWAETASMAAGLATDPDLAKQLLALIRRADTSLARRTLADVGALSTREALEYLQSLDRWDGEDLAHLAEGWIANGVDREGALGLLMEGVDANTDLERAAWVLFAIERAKLPMERETFFERIGRPVRGTTPAECGIDLVPIPGTRDIGEGEPFLMGAPEDEEGRYPWEHQPHPVHLSPFWLGRTPVTEEQWSDFVEPSGGRGQPRRRPRRKGTGAMPAVEISWWAAWLFCRWVGGSLPTEAQWEYACRAGTTTRFSSGDSDDELAEIGWFGGNSGSRIHAVAELPANAWGLHDMHGNVWEWCQDYWASTYVEDQVEDPLGPPGGGAVRVFRGGSFVFSARLCRSAYRSWGLPGSRWSGRGFRVALSPRLES